MSAAPVRPQGAEHRSAKHESTPVNAPANERIAALPYWHGPVEISPLSGGMTNSNYLVCCAGARFVVRLGHDLPVHGVMRFNELAAARAAHAVGIAPEVVFAQPGVMVSRFVEGRTLAPEDLRDERRLPAVADILRRCHRGIPGALRGPALRFRVFQVIRNYQAFLEPIADHLLREQLPRLGRLAAQLEPCVGPVQIVFCHNDLLAANFLDDEHRLWLIDWDYAGFNSPLFDLANLSANNLFSPELERYWLELYLGCRPDAACVRGFGAMKCASVLRETLWGAVSHHCSTIDFDYALYTRTWLERLDRVWADFSLTTVRP